LTQHSCRAINVVTIIQDTEKYMVTMEALLPPNEFGRGQIDNPPPADIPPIELTRGEPDTPAPEQSGQVDPTPLLSPDDRGRDLPEQPADEPKADASGGGGGFKPPHTPGSGGSEQHEGDKPDDPNDGRKVVVITGDTAGGGSVRIEIDTGGKKVEIIDHADGVVVPPDDGVIHVYRNVGHIVIDRTARTQPGADQPEAAPTTENVEMTAENSGQSETPPQSQPEQPRDEPQADASGGGGGVKPPDAPSGGSELGGESGDSPEPPKKVFVEGTPDEKGRLVPTKITLTGIAEGTGDNADPYAQAVNLALDNAERALETASETVACLNVSQFDDMFGYYDALDDAHGQVDRLAREVEVLGACLRQLRARGESTAEDDAAAIVYTKIMENAPRVAQLMLRNEPPETYREKHEQFLNTMLRGIAHQ
jgi:hypothetical protein